MPIVSGYQITEQIQATINTSIYRGVRKQDKAEYPNLAQITRLRHEYKNKSLPLKIYTK
ncbi:hypothetical protein [Aerosakkonema sp. BLCC-F183]|uniref:hypothetical protein n=1 Tax=Aerosakkonema sp. BLCC-F183 TaxID=3342834 RepID=UPI0035BC1D70